MKLLIYKILISISSQLILSTIILIALSYPITSVSIITSCCVFLFLQLFFPKIWKIYTILTSVIIFLYHPTAVNYGTPNFGIIASLFSTNEKETLEYITTIHWTTYLNSLFLATVPLISIKLNCRPILPKLPARYSVIPIIIVLFITVSLTKKEYYKDEEYTGFPLHAQPLEFLVDTGININYYLNELNKLHENLNQPDNWKINNIKQNYKYYVLVIGESVRADYLHLYGMKFNNTPFLDKNANYIMENLYSAGPNTQISLSHSLALNKNNYKEVSIRDNILTLAQKANMDTIWLSNQGAIGRYDTLVSSIATQAQKTFFLKRAMYDFGKNTYDDELIQPFEKFLLQQQSKNNNTLFVLHLMGSHPDICARLRNEPAHYINNHTLNCYIDTIKETDKLLQQIYLALEKTKQPFTILYFSDHGLSHSKSNDADITLRHGASYYENYHVPLVIINSDQTTQLRNSAQRSGLELLQGLAEWMGISSTQLTHLPEFFSSQNSTNIEVLSGGSLLQFLKNLDHDPLPPELRNEKLNSNITEHH